MKLTRLQIQNIACFEDLTLDLTDERGNPASWVVLVGENGTGKSTILQMTAAGFLGSALLSNVASGVNWSGYVRRKSSYETDEETTSRLQFSPVSELSDQGGEPKRHSPGFSIIGDMILFGVVTLLQDRV